MTFHGRASGPIDADVAIVGAGPAGAATACHFARAGFQVVLIDQRRFPRDKVCGDFVGPAALEELDQLGLLSQQIFTTATQIRNGALYVNGQKLIGRPFPHIGNLRDYGLCIPRMLLDEAIVNAAVAAGAHLIEEARVIGYESDPTGVTVFYKHADSQKRLRIRLLIGADGSSSLISRALRGAKPARRDTIVAVRAYFEGVEGPTDQADLYLNSSCFPGYYWLFPTGTNTANVGVGMPLEVCHGTEHQQLGRLLRQLIESDPAIGCRLANAKISDKIVGWPLAIFNPRLPIVDNRVALIGDAAGFINPLSGEGIQYALRSARWCSEALRDALSSDNLSALGLRPYATRAQAEMRFDMAFSRLIIDLANNRALHPLCLLALGTLAKKGVSDSRYYDVAAGVFAGIVSAQEFLNLSFFLYTVKAAAKTLGAAALELLPGRRPRTDRAPLTNAAASMFRNLVQHPLVALGWGATCAMSAVELATQMAISAVQ
jgi:geranylgeranyl reductase family protein